jgi:hypothetical protein
MRRRDVLSLLGGSAAAWPQVVRAQQPAMPVVGFINGASPAPRNFAAFVQGLKEAGFVGRQNVLIEARWAEGNYARLPAMVSLTPSATLSEKWLEILKETFPKVTTVAILTGSGVIYLDRILPGLGARSH